MTPGAWGSPPPQPRKASRLGVLLWLGMLAAIALMLWALSTYFPRGSSRFNDSDLLYTLGLLAVLSTGLLSIRKLNLGQTVRNVLLWVGAGVAILLAYSYQDELRDVGLRLRSELIPGYPLETSAHQMVIAESEGGYLVYGTVNGVRVPFLIDTGASDIVLSPADAQRAGIDLRSLTFDHPYGSANGIGHGAHARVEELKVGGIRMTDIPVSIDKADMSTSLLGMAFLRRLKSFGIGNRKLTLQW